MGPTTKNLKSLLRMPTGCGEQTISSLAPDVFVYNYLKNTNQLTPDVGEMAIRYMTQGKSSCIYYCGRCTKTHHYQDIKRMKT